MNYDSPSEGYSPVHGGYPGTAEPDRDGCVKALIVRPDGTMLHRLIHPTLEALQALVGGWIELIFVTHGVYAYVNEEGKLLDLPANHQATYLAGLEGVDLISGTVVFVGFKDGEETDLPPEWQAL
jgi:hypothetical protein